MGTGIQDLKFKQNPQLPRGPHNREGGGGRKGRRNKTR